MSWEGNNGNNFAPTRWRRITAINGRGSMLIGPDELSEGPGAMVIAPPGVLLRGPLDGEALTCEGWRQARWKLDCKGHVLVDQARPVALAEVELVQVVDELADWAPEQLSWVAAVIERQLRVLIGRMGRDCQGEFHPRSSSAFEELRETKRIANAAFDCVRWKHKNLPAWLTAEPFRWVEKNYVEELLADRRWTKDAIRHFGEAAVASREELEAVLRRIDEAA